MKNLYDEKYFRASLKFQTDNKRIVRFTEEIMRSKPKKVLDVGCGIGVLVRHLRVIGVEAFGVDFADCLKRTYWKEDWYSIANAKQLPFDDGSFDVVFSSDFFEHIQEGELESVLSEMKRVGKSIIVFVAPEASLSLRQKQYHCTNKPMDWWKKKLFGAQVFFSRFDET